MAEQRLRPGVYRATEDNTGNDKIQIDWNWFDLPRNTSIDFQVENMAVYDDNHVSVLRIPSTPTTETSNVGGDYKTRRENAYPGINLGPSQSNWGKRARMFLRVNNLNRALARNRQSGGNPQR